MISGTMTDRKPTIAELIAEGDPLTPKDWNEEKEHQMLERRELVRQRCVKAFSSSPLYQAAAAKNPKYWDDFSVGRI
jgi:hypothetical protein